MTLEAFLNEVFRLVHIEIPAYHISPQAVEVASIYYAAGAEPDMVADEIVIAALEGKEPVL
jgi:hypothetical protein